jgi:hypothetical protein
VSARRTLWSLVGATLRMRSISGSALRESSDRLCTRNPSPSVRGDGPPGPHDLSPRARAWSRNSRQRAPLSA